MKEVIFIARLQPIRPITILIKNRFNNKTIFRIFSLILRYWKWGLCVVDIQRMRADRCGKMTDHQWYILGFIHRMHVQICGKMRKFDCHANNDAYKIHHESSFSALSIELDQVFTKWKWILSFSPTPPPSSSSLSSFFSSSIFACFYLFEKVFVCEATRVQFAYFMNNDDEFSSSPACLNIHSFHIYIYFFIDSSHSFCVLSVR